MAKNGPKGAFDWKTIFQTLLPVLLQILANLKTPPPVPVPAEVKAKAKKGGKVKPSECCPEDQKEALQCIAHYQMHALFGTLGLLADLEDDADAGLDDGDEDDPDSDDED